MTFILARDGIAFSAVWPILLNTVDGVSSVEKLQLDTARVYGVGRRDLLFRVVLPSASPKIFAVLRVSLSLAVILMVISEMIGATNGIGFQVVSAQRTFRVVDGVRYSFPGDLAKVAADGSLILLGRGSQVINSAGEKIFPEEVEEAVKRVDGVVDCIVVGVDDDKFGQAVTAVVSLTAGVEVSAETIIESVKQGLARFKAPKTVVFVEEVPRSPNGKADYKAAQKSAIAAAASTGPPTIHQ